MFSAISRSWAFNEILFDAQDGEFCNQASVSVPTNWFGNTTNANEDIRLMPRSANGTWASGLQNVPPLEGGRFPFDLTISSSTSATTSLDVDFGLSASLAGVIPLGFQAFESWPQIGTSSTPTQLTFDIVGPSQTAVSCYSVFGEGGSLSADTADVIAICYRTGADANGNVDMLASACSDGSPKRSASCLPVGGALCSHPPLSDWTYTESRSSPPR